MMVEGIWSDMGDLKAVARYIKGNPTLDDYAKDILSQSSEKKSRRSKVSLFAASVISLGYLIFALFIDFETFIQMLLFLLLPLACIFFGDKMGEMIGFRFRLTFAAPTVDKSSPGSVVVFMGWVLLLLPLVIILIMM